MSGQSAAFAARLAKAESEAFLPLIRLKLEVPPMKLFFFEKVGKYIFLLFKGNFVKGFHSQVSHWRAQYVLPVDLGERSTRQEYRTRNHNTRCFLTHFFLLRIDLKLSKINNLVRADAQFRLTHFFFADSSVCQRNRSLHD